jgi:hypothetical protein
LGENFVFLFYFILFTCNQINRISQTFIYFPQPMANSNQKLCDSLLEQQKKACNSSAHRQDRDACMTTVRLLCQQDVNTSKDLTHYSNILKCMALDQCNKKKDQLRADPSQSQQSNECQDIC